VNGRDNEERNRAAAPLALVLLLLVSHGAGSRVMSDPALDNAFRP
jgi:hypothetical protein